MRPGRRRQPAVWDRPHPHRSAARRPLAAGPGQRPKAASKWSAAAGTIYHSAAGRVARPSAGRHPAPLRRGAWRHDDSRTRRRRILHDRLMLARARAAREPPSEAAIGRPSAQIRPIDSWVDRGTRLGTTGDVGSRRRACPGLTRYFVGHDGVGRWRAGSTPDTPTAVGPKTTDQKVRGFESLRARSLRSLPRWGPPSGALTSFAPPLGPTFGRAHFVRSPLGLNFGRVLNCVAGQADSTAMVIFSSGSRRCSAQVLSRQVESRRAGRLWRSGEVCVAGRVGGRWRP